MNTNVVIDGHLLHQAMQASGIRNKREAVETSLRSLVKLKQQEAIRSFQGKLPWGEDPEVLREEGS